MGWLRRGVESRNNACRIFILNVPPVATLLNYATSFASGMLIQMCAQRVQSYFAWIPTPTETGSRSSSHIKK